LVTIFERDEVVAAFDTVHTAVAHRALFAAPAHATKIRIRLTSRAHVAAWLATL
jgi:hypothetical protein